jgi:hypothetical protein
VRKKITGAASSDAGPSSEGWLDVERLAQVEISSEEPTHPIEAALLPGRAGGWRASEPGEQLLRIVFDEPRQLRRIWLEFVEPSAERTQEYALRWQVAGGSAPRELLRQQWAFSPGGSTRETEDHRVDLSDVTALELTIRPDIAGGPARASLKALRLN